MADLAAGMVMLWTTGSAPTGWLLCDGSEVSRTTYSDLFAVIGTTYGAGDGSTTFNLPDFSDSALFGVDGTADFLDLTTSGGSSTHSHSVGSHTLTTSEMPSHDHSNVHDGSQDQSDAGSFSVAEPNRQALGSRGGGGSHNHGISSDDNTPPSLVLNYVVKT